VCRQLGRRYVLIDDNPVAIDVMRERLGASLGASSLGRAART
jgi:DNA modification methylase